MDDAGPPRPANSRQLRIAVEESVDQGSFSSTGAGVYRQASRLVDHDQVFVLVEDRQLTLFGDDAFFAGRGQLGGQPGPRTDGLRSRSRAMVDLHPTVTDESLYLISWQLEGSRQVAIETFTGGFRGSLPGLHSDVSAIAGLDSWAGDRRSESKVSIAMNTMPTVMALSATLKVCQW